MSDEYKSRCVEHTAELSKLTEKVANLCDKIDGLTDQVSQTNGRVKSLEIWKAGLVGSVAVLMLPNAAKLVALFQP